MRARLDACGVDAHSQCSASSMTKHMLRRFTNTPLHSQWSAGGTTELCLFTSKPPSLLCSASAECLTPYLCGVNAHSMHSASAAAATGHIHVPSVVSTTTNTITTAYGILYKSAKVLYIPKAPAHVQMTTVVDVAPYRTSVELVGREQSRVTLVMGLVHRRRHVPSTHSQYCASARVNYECRSDQASTAHKRAREVIPAPVNPRLPHVTAHRCVCTIRTTQISQQPMYAVGDSTLTLRSTMVHSSHISSDGIPIRRKRETCMSTPPHSLCTSSAESRQSAWGWDAQP
ncbi:hypothetical protein DFP72DRAFT_855484 [Ephemerocybe angulata]|uniref:Uncharacterized protein n=1 Tax=Ephemerocybe angulata TaxID=980116 RepID=A0A8H6LXI1_9AGAR|nr:hypothetical protein DFP72DRAFT_855476 [Tulosesus angulatus]KAF6746427.1 hypothetical protein DFP72DRAFT_855484 [Tulosesus angulatus]